MTSSLGKLIEPIPFKGYLLASLVVNLIVVISIFALSRFIPPEVPLYYGLARGEEQLAPATALVLPAIISIVILFINTGFMLIVGSDFLKKVFLSLIIATTALSTITVVRIILLVGSF